MSLSIVIVIWICSLIFLFLLMSKKIANINASLRTKCEENAFLEQWLIALNSGKTLSDYMKSKGFHKVIFYGNRWMKEMISVDKDLLDNFNIVLTENYKSVQDMIDEKIIDGSEDAMIWFDFISYREFCCSNSNTLDMEILLVTDVLFEINKGLY